MTMPTLANAGKGLHIKKPAQALSEKSSALIFSWLPLGVVDAGGKCMVPWILGWCGGRKNRSLGSTPPSGDCPRGSKAGPCLQWGWTDLALKIICRKQSLNHEKKYNYRQDSSLLFFYFGFFFFLCVCHYLAWMQWHSHVQVLEELGKHKSFGSLALLETWSTDYHCWNSMHFPARSSY